MNNLIPLLVAIPLGVAFAIPLVFRRPRLADLVTTSTLVVLSGVCVALQGQEFVYHMGAWPTPVGIDLRVDSLTTLILLMINVLALIVSIYSWSYLNSFTSRHRYYSLMLFQVAGMNGVVLTADLFNLYVFLEIASIASYALVAFAGADEDFEAAFKYAVFGGISSALILFGIGLLYGITGTLNMSHLAARFGGSELTAVHQFALGLLFCGFSVKSALVPFHSWLPDAYSTAPASISALLSGAVSKVIGVYVLARLLFNVFGITDDLLMLMRWMGGITMVVGGLLALGQWDMKRLFAYSSVSHVGLIVLAFGIGTTWGLTGALFHFLNHAVFKPLLFLNSGQVELTTGRRDLREMQGLGHEIPITAGTNMVASLSAAGIPPLNGFWSKLIIVVAAVASGFTGWAVAVVLVSILTLAYQMKVQKEAFFSNNIAGSESTSAETLPAPARESYSMAVPMILLAVGCAALSLLVVTGLEQPMLIAPAAEVLMNGTTIW